MFILWYFVSDNWWVSFMKLIYVSFWIKALIYFHLADSELVEFLTEEIAAEKSNQKPVVEIPGFVSKKEGAELTFTKNHGNEKYVTIFYALCNNSMKGF